MSESYHAAQLPLFPSRELEAYLAGVIKGDGWCTGYSIGLRVADRDFAEAFAAAITQVFNVPLRIGQERQRYWIVRTSNKTGKYTYLLSLEPTTTSEKAFWLRGLFDSEGNAQLCKLPRGKNSYDRRVSLYSTNTETLNTASRFLTDLAISHRIRSTNNSPGHRGTKCVYELILQASEANFARFQSLIGSCLARKQATLAGSYLDRFAREQQAPSRPLQPDGSTGGCMSAPATRVFLLPAALYLTTSSPHQPGLLRQVLQRAWDDYNLDLATSHPAEHPYVQLAVALSAASREGACRLLLAMPDGWQILISWLEQLMEESLGKGGKGVVVFDDQTLNIIQQNKAKWTDRLPLSACVLLHATRKQVCLATIPARFSMPRL